MRAAFLGLFLCACGAQNTASGANPDASVDAPTEGSCPVSIAAYCATSWCPSGPSAAVQHLCAGYNVCVNGDAVDGWHVDVGVGYLFDGGALTTVVDFTPNGQVCVAGAPGTTPSSFSCTPQGSTACGDAGAD